MTAVPDRRSEATAARLTATDFVSVPELVAARATAAPDSLALMEGNMPLTYAWLDRQAERVAARLQSLGIGPETVVGLYLPRTLNMVIGAFGILKSGAAYLPLDPAYPRDRLKFMLDDAGAPALVTSRELGPSLERPNRATVYLDAAAIKTFPHERNAAELRPESLAYVIYTSGSSGTPKGVELTHRGLANLVSWHNRAFVVGPADRASHVAGLGFDAAVWELWPYLAAGASVHFADDATRTSAEGLRDWLLARRISISFVSTPLAEQLLSGPGWPADTSLRLLLTGGDTLRRHPPAGLPFELVNNYGPTEATVVATSGIVAPAPPGAAPPSIGSPIAGTWIRLLDERLQPVPRGEAGQLCIGGLGLARGYRNQPGLTAERFVPDPSGAEPGSRLYLTGDLARELPDGRLAFLGRMDDQIKIRGYRVEPGEISAALDRHDEIRESLVVAHGEGEARRLVAYLVLSAGTRLTHSGLRDFLRSYLPDYMLPSAFVPVAQFPLTPNGKIDRGTLPMPTSDNTLQDDDAPAELSDTEQQIADMLGELLQLEEIDVDDNFFMLGGHSLLGAQLIARLRQTFGIEIALRSLFEAPTVASLAAEVERLSQAHAG